ncbi:MAG: TraU family protein [Candidatus Omnitrophota bacterium]
MRIICIILFVLSWHLSAQADENVAALAARADWSCVRFQVAGACRRSTPPYAGIRVRYWQPVLMVETTRHPGQSGIEEFKGIVSLMTGQQPVSSSCGVPGQSDTTNLQVNEAHVFGFPFSDAFSLMIEAPCEGMPDLGGKISYLSEQDREEWRDAREESRHPLSRMTGSAAAVCGRYGDLFPGLCLGVWGPLYPRTGFSVHASAPAGSAIAAFRAVDIAALKPQAPHRVISPVLFWPDIRADCLQMVSPVKKSCMAIGADPVFWDGGATARDGRYVWLYWRKKECCLF